MDATVRAVQQVVTGMDAVLRSERDGERNNDAEGMMCSSGALIKRMVGKKR